MRPSEIIKALVNRKAAKLGTGKARVLDLKFEAILEYLDLKERKIDKKFLDKVLSQYSQRNTCPKE